MANKKILYINHGTEDLKFSCKENQTYHYNLHNGKIINDHSIDLSNSKLFHETAIKNRIKYTDFIYKINENYIDQFLVNKSNLSYFHFTDLCNKRTEMTNCYDLICHLINIKSLNNIYQFEKAVFINCEIKFIDSCRPLFKKIKIINPKKTLGLSRLLKRLGSQVKFYFKVLVCIYINKILTFKRYNKKQNKGCYLTIYPKLYNDKGKDEKYGKMMKAHHTKIVFMLTDGMIQNLKIISYIKYLLKLKKIKNTILIDSYLTINDLIRSIVNLIKFEFKTQKLTQKRYFYDGLNISSLIIEEIYFSLYRLPRLTLYDNCIGELQKSSNIKRFTYYLFEYSFGKYLTYLFKRNNLYCKLAGFQHGPTSKRKLLYLRSKEECKVPSNNYLFSVPAPDKILCEDKLSKMIYAESGYKNIEIMNSVYRYDYLKGISILNKTNQNKILLVPGLHDGKLLLDYIYNNGSLYKNYYFKPHPRANNKYLYNKDKNKKIKVTVIINHIKQLFKLSDEIYCTYSSVGYEAYLIGLQVTILCFNSKINESPLLDFKSNKVKILYL